MSILNGTQLLEAIGRVDDALVEESLEFFSARPVAVPASRPRRHLLAPIAVGVAAAVLCGVVAVAPVLRAGLWENFMDLLAPLLHPDETHTEETTEDVTDGETSDESTDETDEGETEPPYTEGLLIKSYDGECHVNSFSGNPDSVVIPAYYCGNPVVQITTYAFYDENEADKIKQITLPDTLREIGDKAFLQCYTLESIHIPASVTYIAPDAFKECWGLRSVTVDENNPVYRSSGNCIIEIATGMVVVGCGNSVLPEDGSVRQISTYAFHKNTALTEIRLPASVEVIEEQAFEGCTALVRVLGGEGLTTVREKAFKDCTALAEFTFPQGLKVVEQEAFANCSSLTRVVLPKEMEQLNWYVFAACGSLSEIVLPERVGDMGREVLRGTALRSVTVPEGITNMNDMLYGARKLETVYLPATLEKINDSEFSFCYELKDIYYNGTLEQWLAICEQDQLWMGFVEEWTLHCTDGMTEWRYVRGNGMKQVE